MINKSTNIVENVCVWDGNTESWNPPADYLMLVQSTIPAIVWTPVAVDNKITDFVLTEELGQGAVGFTWNGSVVTTNQPKPELPIN